MTQLMEWDEAIGQYDPVIGIEVHVELGTRTKMFDDAPVSFGAAPNSQVTPVSLGLPGALPVVNKKAVESAIRIGLALGCEIAEYCRFARKNYFYPDMPKNFQTSQYDEPIAFEGALDVELDDGTVFTVWAPTAFLADCLSTGLFVLGAEAALAFPERHPEVGVLLLEPVTGGLRARVAGALAGRVRAVAPEVHIEERPPVAGSLAPQGDPH